MNNDFKALFHQKCKDYDSLCSEFQDMKDLSQQIEKELEGEIEHLTKEKKRLLQENEKAKQQLQELKKKYADETSFLEKKTDRLTTENSKLKENLNVKNKEVTQCEIEIERIESQVRESQTVIADLESKIDYTFERLAIVQSQLELTKARNEEEIQRLKDKLTESQSEALAYKARESMKKSVATNRPKDNKKNYAKTIPKCYAAFEAKGGDDPAPRKKIKIAQGPGLREQLCYDPMQESHCEPEPLEEEPTFHQSKNINSRSKQGVSFSVNDLKILTQAQNGQKKCFAIDKSFHSQIRNLYNLNNINKGFSESLGIVNNLIEELRDRENTVFGKTLLGSQMFNMTYQKTEGNFSFGCGQTAHWNQ